MRKAIASLLTLAVFVALSLVYVTMTPRPGPTLNLQPPRFDIAHPQGTTLPAPVAATQPPARDLSKVDLTAEMANNTPDLTKVPNRDLSGVAAIASQVEMPNDALADIAAASQK
jgi:hypothetical protein